MSEDRPPKRAVSIDRYESFDETTAALRKALDEGYTVTLELILGEYELWCYKEVDL